MPYIELSRRTMLDELLEPLERTDDLSLDVGELNYLITKILLLTYPKRYADFNALIGMLECCKLEFYRRAVAAYEDQKIQENGDVYA